MKLSLLSSKIEFQVGTERPETMSGKVNSTFNAVTLKLQNLVTPPCSGAEYCDNPSVCVSVCP